MNWLKEKPLKREFYNRDTVEVACDLLGKHLIRRIDGKVLVGKIVETEAYLPFDDPPSHSFIGKTKRTEILFGHPGFTYVYSIHRYHCLNMVAEGHNIPGSALIRGLEPIDGVEEMMKLRGTEIVKNLTSGPGKICQAMGITRVDNGIDVTDSRSDIFVIDGERVMDEDVVSSPRIGISKATEWMYRFSVRDNEFVSRPAKKTVT